jgi:arylsulfatase A-like enzyme
MIDHDRNVGQVLDLLDELGLAEDTIVVYSTDNGPHRNSWPDAGTTPFRSEKDTNWEGAFWVPEMIRWPGKIEAGTVSNEIIQHHDWLPTLLAAAGDPDVMDKLKKGYTEGNKDFKVHIDGFNLLPYLMGEVEHSPLRTDPYEYADITSNTYYDWFLRRDFFVFYATAMATKFLDTFKEFPPRHPPASFSVDQAVEKLHKFLAKD